MAFPNYCTAQEAEANAEIFSTYLAEGKMERAGFYADSLIKENPKEALYYRLRARFYIESNEREKAEKDLEKSLDLDSDCADCYVAYALITFKFDLNLEKTAEYLNKALAIDDSLDYAHNFQAQVYAANKNIPKAIESINRAILLEPESGEHYVMRGRFHLFQKKYLSSLEDLNKGVELWPGQISFLGRSEYHIYFQDWDKALADIDSALAYNSSTYEALLSKAAVLDHLFRLEESLDFINQAIAINDSDATAFINRGLTLHKLEDMDGACADNQRALDLLEETPQTKSKIEELKVHINDFCDSDKSSFYFQRGIAEYNKNDFQKAIEFYNEGVQKFPNSVFLRAFRGNAYLKIGDYPNAIADYKYTIANKEKLKAEIAENDRFKNNPAQFEEYYLISIASNWQSLGQAELYNGNYDDAIVSLGEAIRQVEAKKYIPEMKRLLSIILNIRAMVFYMKGVSKKALADLKQSQNYTYSNPVASILEAMVYLNEKGAAKYDKIPLGIGNFENHLPTINPNKITPEILAKAMNSLDVAIIRDFEKQFPFAYLLRAQIKLILKRGDHCVDALKAKELGIEDSLEQLKVKCEP